MKKLWQSVACLAVGLSIVSTGFAASEQALDKIVAVVNDDVITQSELQTALQSTRSQLYQENAPVPQQQVLQKQVLNQLINKKLQLQIAKQANVTVSAEELDATINHIAAQNHVSTQELYNRVNMEGLKIADYRKEIRDQLVLQKLQQHEVVGQVSVSKQEVNQFMHAPIWQNAGPKEYDVKDILVPVADNASAADVAKAKAAATAIYKGLSQGKKLEAVAGKTAIESNELGWRKLSELPSAFADHVKKMPAHSLAGPIQTANGFHVLALVATRSAKQEAMTPSRQQAQQALLQRKFDEAVQNWVSKIRSQAFILTNLS